MHRYIFLLCQLREPGNNNTPVASSVHTKAHILVSNKRNHGFIENCLILELGPEQLKMNLKHLALPEMKEILNKKEIPILVELCQRETKANWSSQWPKLAIK